MLLFQSTRPMRGATSIWLRCSIQSTGFNPRAPCGARRHLFQRVRTAGTVSIHAPHAGRDHGKTPQGIGDTSFNPRAPCGARLHIPVQSLNTAYVSIHAPHAGRDDLNPATVDYADVSIHAPHAGRDSFTFCRKEWGKSFNPRAPCGARPLPVRVSTHRCCFNPRAPCGARLRGRTVSVLLEWFQSTRPMRGATQ